jgi:hypothetical protein
VPDSHPCKKLGSGFAPLRKKAHSSPETLSKPRSSVAQPLLMVFREKLVVMPIHHTHLTRR